MLFQGDAPDPRSRAAQLLDRLHGVRPTSSGWKGKCPAHDDQNPSLSINCDGSTLLLHCHAGCPTESVLQAIGLDMSFLQARQDGGDGRVHASRARGGTGWQDPRRAADYVAKKERATVEAIYDYASVDGTVQFAVVRLRLPDDKTFRPLHLLDGTWRIGDPKDRLLPLFRLPQIKTEQVVLVAEGEKCVLQAEALGMAATTSAHGAKSPNKSDWTTIAHKHVVVWADLDAPGSHYVAEVVQILRQVNPEIRVSEIVVEGLPEGGDICDWHAQQIAAGLTHEQVAERLAQLVASATPYPAGGSTYSTYSAGPTPSSDARSELRPLPEGKAPQPFPIDEAFPPSCRQLRDYVVAVAESFQVPVDLPALLAIAAFGLGASRCYEIEARRDWREVISIYVLILLRSGERKSAVFSRLIGPIYEWQKHQASGMAKEISAFQNDVAVMKEKVRRGRRRAAAEDEAEDDGESLDDLTRSLAALQQTEPKPPSMVASEATTEAIADMLFENKERGLLASPEGDAIDVMLGRYGQGRPNFGLWLSGHSGDAITIRRKGRPPLSLSKPVLTVAMTIQPAAAKDLLDSKQAEGRGVLARFLYSLPATRVGYRNLTPDPVPTALSDWYGTRLHRLLDTPVPDEPRMLRLTDEAGDLLLVFRERVEVDLRPSGLLGDQNSWGSKLPGAILRIAAVLHLVGNGGFGNGLVDLPTMNAALSWAPYLIAHQELVMGQGGEDPNLVIAKKIVAWIRRKNLHEFSANDAFNAVRSSTAPSSKDVIEPLSILLDHGAIRALPPKPRPASARGRPPSPRYEVHPDVLRNPGKAPQNTHNTQNPPDDPLADDAAGGGGT